ncbi:LamG domain-containing protein [Haliangium ochraceum]|uniref:LamG domain protein jellyroll fold domain protein n=1 Tax=Haliangium ochraceum (strain DSM 14365 / JCM 11303 / SMP-2) TaxID=502025 RepID=D0LTN6_HALO1|nr:LamG domain-containing protein [Haliangium ochraceum]ACY15730.1 hypothetical protein Hoch_3228 [Haliangium ochraceum DSM 14365]
MKPPRVSAILCALALAGCGKVILPADGSDAGGGPDSGACANSAYTDDDFACGFAEAEFRDVDWVGDVVTLSGDSRAGEFDSRVFAAPAAASVWSELSWQARAPYHKALPGGGAIENGYPEGGADMRDNVLLLHLDESALAAGERLVDASGRENHAIVASSGESMERAEGRFASAVNVSLATYVSVPTSDGDDFSFGTGDFTWALWVKSTQDCQDGNRVYMGVDDEGPDRVHLWLGCTDGVFQRCTGGAADGRAGGTMRSDHGEADGVTYCSTTRVNDGAWHHLALTKAGHESATVTLYVDGVAEDIETGTFIKPFTLLDQPDFAIGAFSRDSFQAEGSFDEVAVWRRALAADEIAALHRRGALRLGFQVRACQEPACADEPAFVGPAGDSEAHYTDPDEALGPGRPVTLGTEQRGPYFQYRAVFESDIAGQSPALGAVSVQPYQPSP